jgi:hypothetical protein
MLSRLCLAADAVTVCRSSLLWVHLYVHSLLSCRSLSERGRVTDSSSGLSCFCKRSWLAECIPVDAAGQPLVVTDSSTVAELQSWPQQFDDQWHALDFQVHFMILNPSFSRDPLFVMQLAVMATVSGASGSLANPSRETFYLQSGRQIGLSVSASVTQKLDGAEHMQLSYENTGELVYPATTAASDVFFQRWLNSTTDALEREKMIAFKANPNVTYGFWEVTVFPSSLRAQVVTEVQPYTLSNFVSDVGGVLNLLALSFLLLFPITFEPTQPRTFLAMWLIRKWRNRKAFLDGSGELPAEAAHTVASEEHNGRAVPMQPQGRSKANASRLGMQQSLLDADS